MDKKWKVIALWVLPITIVILITWQILGSSTNTQVNQTNTSNPSRNAPVAKISYGRFLDYVKAGRVTSVDIYDGGRNAIVESVDPEIDNRIQRLRVDLPGLAPELVSSLKDEGISFDIHPPKHGPSGCWNSWQPSLSNNSNRRADFTFKKIKLNARWTRASNAIS